LSQLVCIGLSHKTAPVEVRERATLSAEQQRHLLTSAAAGTLPGVSERVVLDTCNRTELYGVGVPTVVGQVLRCLLAENSRLSDDELAGCTYLLDDVSCIEHLLRVTAGLDSQVLGEPQVLGQVADAYEQASTLHATGSTLSTLMQQAIHVGKRVRHETVLGEGSLSISSIAAIYSTQVIGALQGACLLIVGAGEMAQAAASAFLRQGIERLLVANRTLEHAQEIASQWNGKALPFTQLGEGLAEADLIVAAAFAPHTLIHGVDIMPVLERRGGRPLVIFDIALPRIVSSDVKTIPGVTLYDLDDLQTVADAHRASRQNAIPQAEQILAEAARAFAQWQVSRAVVPVIQELRAKAESIRQAELKAALRRMPNLTKREQQIVEELSQRLVNKLLHQPTLKLKAQPSEEPAEIFANLVSDLFDLEIADKPL
jgi:glutamyl-tRNA reductase